MRLLLRSLRHVPARVLIVVYYLLHGPVDAIANGQIRHGYHQRGAQPPVEPTQALRGRNLPERVADRPVLPPGAFVLDRQAGPYQIQGIASRAGDATGTCPGYQACEGRLIPGGTVPQVLFEFLVAVEVDACVGKTMEDAGPVSLLDRGKGNKKWSGQKMLSSPALRSSSLPAHTRRLSCYFWRDQSQGPSNKLPADWDGLPRGSPHPCMLTPDLCPPPTYLPEGQEAFFPHHFPQRWQQTVRILRPPAYM